MPKCILSGQVKSRFTQEQADQRYLQLTGGTLTGNVVLTANENNDYNATFSIGDSQNGIRLSSNGTVSEIFFGNGFQISDSGITQLRSPTQLSITTSSGPINISAMDGLYIQSSITIPEPIADNNPTTKLYVDSKAPIGRVVTLSASAWSSNSQTVTVQGVNANTTGQIIDWGAHDQASYTALASANLFVSASSSANQLVFTALGTAPTSDVQVNIKIQEGQGV